MSENNQNLNARLAELQRFWFLADAPMFIDGRLVERLYDAIFRPEVQLVSVSDGKASEIAKKLARATTNTLEIGGKSPPILSLFGLEIAAKASRKSTNTNEEAEKDGNSSTRTFSAISTPERYLEKLISLYVEEYPQRLLWVKNDLTKIQTLEDPSKSLDWAEIEDENGLLGDGKGPRPIIVLDLDADATLMPMYGELTNGKDCELLKDYLNTKREKEDFIVPKYPSSPKDNKQELTNYWKEISKHFDSRAVIRTIETATSDKTARFDWIDFRLLCSNDHESPVMPPHLHFMPRGEYPTGIFAYHLVRRAYRFGIRIVGTLKRGQDINVLAVYER